MNREDFPMLNQDIIYFDNGATTLKPMSVINKISDYYMNYSANAHRGDYDISYKVDVEIENARNKVANFINAKREEVIFTSGATESLNMIVECFFRNTLKSGDEILLTLSEHASNVMPWFKVAASTGAVVKYIELDDNYKVTLDNVKKAITPNTKVISLAHITNVIGDIRPIKEITEFAHQNNILVVVDGAQSVPHLKTDVKYLDCDFLAFSLHKMCGPTGVGVLYGKYELLNEFIPYKLGGGMNESFDSINQVVLKELPMRLEAGTPNIAGIIATGEAIDYINSIGIDKIHERENYLKNYLVNKLKDIRHIKIVNNNSDSGIVTFIVDDIFAQDVSVYLNKYRVCVRAGNHCTKNLKFATGIKNTIRVSLYFYNTTHEIDKLVMLLSDKDKIMKEMF